MITPDTQPAPAIHPADIIEVCDRYLPMAGVLSYSDVVARIEDLEQLEAARLGQLHEMAAALVRIVQNLHRNTDASHEEAIEEGASAAKRLAAFLQQAHARPDLSDPPENVVLFAAHRIQVAGGRL
jgi:hypothetical protein